MSEALAHSEDAFRRMLGWSAVMHAVVLTGVVVAGRMADRPNPLAPPENVAFVIPGVPGPIQGTGGGAPAPSPPPPPEPEPEPPPEPEPKEEPRVVRPTREERKQIPLPDAKTTNRKPRPEPPPSGLTGRDAASAPSAQLKETMPGVPGLGLGGSGGGSGFDQDFEYTYYALQMLTRIQQNWNRVPVRGTTFAIIRFTILRDGSLRNVEVEQSSGVSFLDRAAQRAVILSDPLPPLPNSYPRDQVGVHLRFEYSDQSRP